VTADAANPYRSHSFDELWALPTVYRDDALAGRVVLVTGAAGGIGGATSVLCARLGATLVLSGRTLATLDELAGRLRDRGTDVLTVAGSVRDPEQVGTVVDAAWDRFGRLDVVVNNAGGQFSAPALDISPKGWHAVVETNLYGTWFMMQAAARRWAEAGDPAPGEDRCVVNISTITGRGAAGIAHTAAARGGQINLTRYLAVEWAPLRIRANAIAVGVVASEGLATYPESARASFGHNPMRRLGDVWDVAQGVVYLAAPSAAFVTGTTLEVTGGEHVWGEYWPLGRPEFFEGKVYP
jgi:NAD(P)-dependent dehydrogenase (short-subunit alcohol dehydrogenase family)